MSEVPAASPSTDPLDRPSWACQLHGPPRGAAWWPADDGYVTCAGCDQGLRERLAEVSARYLQLDARPGASYESGGRGAPGFGSRPPLSLHVVALRDPRSSPDAHVWLGRDGRVHQESSRPPLSVHGTLSTQAWSIAEHRAGPDGPVGPHDRDDVFALIRYIERHLSYAARHAELVVELDRAVRDLLGQLRPATGDGRKRVGRCPVVLEVAEQAGDEGVAGVPGDEVVAVEQVCGATLYAPLAGSSVDSAAITCFACGSSWGFADWLSLGDLLSAAEDVSAEHAA